MSQFGRFGQYLLKLNRPALTELQHVHDIVNIHNFYSLNMAFIVLIKPNRLLIILMAKTQIAPLITLFERGPDEIIALR